MDHLCSRAYWAMAAMMASGVMAFGPMACGRVANSECVYQSVAHSAWFVIPVGSGGVSCVSSFVVGP